MRSRLIVRHKRRCIYLSNLIVCIAAGFTLCAAYLLPHTALSMLLPGEYEAAATVLAYTALYVLIAMLCQNKAYSTAGCLLLVFALLFAGIRIVSVLNEPAYYSGYSYMENGVTVAEGRSETPIIFAARSGSFTNFCTISFREIRRFSCPPCRRRSRRCSPRTMDSFCWRRPASG